MQLEALLYNKHVNTKKLLLEIQQRLLDEFDNVDNVKVWSVQDLKFDVTVEGLNFKQDGVIEIDEDEWHDVIFLWRVGRYNNAIGFYGYVPHKLTSVDELFASLKKCPYLDPEVSS